MIGESITGFSPLEEQNADVWTALYSLVHYPRLVEAIEQYGRHMSAAPMSSRQDVARRVAQALLRQFGHIFTQVPLLQEIDAYEILYSVVTHGNWEAGVGRLEDTAYEMAYGDIPRPRSQWHRPAERLTIDLPATLCDEQRKVELRKIHLRLADQIRQLPVSIQKRPRGRPIKSFVLYVALYRAWFNWSKAGVPRVSTRAFADAVLAWRLYALGRGQTPGNQGIPAEDYLLLRQEWPELYGKHRIDESGIRQKLTKARKLLHDPNMPAQSPSFRSSICPIDAPQQVVSVRSYKWPKWAAGQSS